MTRPLDQLEKTIADRAACPSDESYTCQLLRGGVEKIGRKVLEEAGEVVDAAGQPGGVGQAHLIGEVADLVYHVLVMLRLRDCPFAASRTKRSH
jgi:phosphoribosyl-ATP pyrophosphohydrolase